MPMNQDRRNFLKLLLVGGGFGLAGTFLGPTLLELAMGRREDTVDAKNFSTFNVVENNGELKIFSKSGEELFVIDNGK